MLSKHVTEKSNQNLLRTKSYDGTDWPCGIQISFEGKILVASIITLLRVYCPLAQSTMSFKVGQLALNLV